MTSVVSETNECKRLQDALRESEQRQTFMLSLGDGFRAAPDEDAIGALCTRRMAEHLHADRCFLLEISPQTDRLVIGPECCRHGVTPLAGEHRWLHFPTTFRRIETETLVFEDLPADPHWPETEKAKLAEMDIGAFIGSAVCKRAGEIRSALVVVSTRPREWAQSDIAMVEDVAARASAEMQRIRAETTLRETAERLALAVEVGRLATWDWKLKTGAITWNDEHYRMQGYAVGEVAPSFDAWVARVHPDDREETIAALLSARDEHRPYAHNFRTLHPDGSVHWCLARCRYFSDAKGQPSRIIGMMEDGTERKQKEEALRASEAQLKEANRAKDEFLVMLSHELRNPLAPIVTTLQLMKLRAPDVLRTERATIEQQVHRLADLVDDLLDLA
jgi:PAS domain S-box-containing protein